MLHRALPIRSEVRIALAVRLVNELPADELGAIDTDRNRLEHLDVLGIVVEHGVGKDHVVTDRVLLMVARFGQRIAMLVTRHEHHRVRSGQHELGIAR